MIYSDITSLKNILFCFVLFFSLPRAFTPTVLEGNNSMLFSLPLGFPWPSSALVAIRYLVLKNRVLVSLYSRQDFLFYGTC